nr:MAG TPA: hypothetical protein [Caudoviricetes sp.]
MILSREGGILLPHLLFVSVQHLGHPQKCG